MNNYPKIAIIYLSFHSDPYIEDMVSAMKKITYPKDKLELVIVDNPHPKYGSSVKFLEQNVMTFSGKEICHTTLLPQRENSGFSGGNNVGVKWAIDNNFDYVYFHNNDGFLSANALEPIVEEMEKDKKIGQAQSLLMLYPETDLINSTGNSFHYLGFGFCADYRHKLSEKKLEKVTDIAYASGAGTLMRVDLLEKLGLWGEDFFMYHEDLEYSFRMRAAGYRVVLVSNSVFFHKYQFSRSIEKFYFMDRNRHAVMLMYFRIPTLIILAPMGIVLELAMLLFATKNGWLNQKIKVYSYWLKISNWKKWLKKRKKIQKMRKVKDRDLLKWASSEIKFQESSMDSWVLKYIGNPLMKIYFAVVKVIIFW